MAKISRRLIRSIGYDTASFNISYFWDPGWDRIWLLEINTRISESHAPLFHMVDGLYHHQVMVDPGLVRKLLFRTGGGDYPVAANFMVRRYADAWVACAPSRAEIAVIEDTVAGTQIQVAVRKGTRLSELHDQASYNYEAATIFVGAHSQPELEGRFPACRDRLPLRFVPLAAD